jgi:ParB family chromosome partitioning protein
MAEPKRDNLLPLPKNRRTELSPALRKLLGPKRAERSATEAEPEVEVEAQEVQPDERKFADLVPAHAISAPAEVQSYDGDDFEEDEDVPEEDEEVVDVADEVDEGLSSAAVEGGIAYIPVGAVSFSPYQTREILSDADLDGLAESLREKGLLQPILVRAVKDADSETPYELVAGERRFRAAQRAGLAEIPAIVRELSDQESAEFAVIENAQRENLNPIEEALAYKTLVDEFKLPQREVAKLVGKSRSVITNSLRLLQLEEEILEYIKAGDLSTGHGKVLLTLDDPAVQRRLARRVVKNELSVRALEVLVSRIDTVVDEEEFDEDEERIKAAAKRAENKIRDILEMELVNLSYDNQGRRKLQLTFESEAAWRRFMSRVRD